LFFYILLQPIFKHNFYSGAIQGLFRSYSGASQRLFRSYSGAIQGLFRGYSGAIQELFRGKSAAIQELFRSYSGFDNSIVERLTDINRAAALAAALWKKLL
ncbi:MAG: hypothetical protein HF312_19295, partial [Ignavibacteria bacterium]|nr:hypothetical protein [Ignavibacteria bacterium]